MDYPNIFLLFLFLKFYSWNIFVNVIIAGLSFLLFISNKRSRESVEWWWGKGVILLLSLLLPFDALFGRQLSIVPSWKVKTEIIYFNPLFVERELKHWFILLNETLIYSVEPDIWPMNIWTMECKETSMRVSEISSEII